MKVKNLIRILKMKIIKYEKTSEDKYKIYLDNSKTITLHEDVILKNKLLFKKEIDLELLNQLDEDNNYQNIYSKCVKYISIRLRSQNEIKEYLERKNIEPVTINKIIEKLLNEKLLNDEIFAKAFIKDKLNFTTMGPYRIELELKKHKIEQNIISNCMQNIDYDLVEQKINKQITKLMKSHKNKSNLKNKIYQNLLSLGYSNEMIIDNLNKYNF